MLGVLLQRIRSTTPSGTLQNTFVSISMPTGTGEIASRDNTKDARSLISWRADYGRKKKSLRPLQPGAAIGRWSPRRRRHRTRSKHRHPRRGNFLRDLGRRTLHSPPFFLATRPRSNDRPCLFCSTCLVPPRFTSRIYCFALTTARIIRRPPNPQHTITSRTLHIYSYIAAQQPAT